MKIKAHIVHCVPNQAGFKYPNNVGSILVLVEKYGTRFWLGRQQIINYDDLNMLNPYDLQDIKLVNNDDIKDFVNNSINNKMIDLCKYKK